MNINKWVAYKNVKREQISRNKSVGILENERKSKRELWKKKLNSGRFNEVIFVIKSNIDLKHGSKLIS